MAVKKKTAAEPAKSAFPVGTLLVAAEGDIEPVLHDDDTPYTIEQLSTMEAQIANYRDLCRYIAPNGHASDCELHNAPAEKPGVCTCEGASIEQVKAKYDAMVERIGQLSQNNAELHRYAKGLEAAHGKKVETDSMGLPKVAG